MAMVRAKFDGFFQRTSNKLKELPDLIKEDIQNNMVKEEITNEQKDLLNEKLNNK